MCLDSQGFIWICTDAGLVKYDANSFKIFNSSDGLPDNTVFQVKEDRKGRIWYRTYSGNIGYISNDSVFNIGANDSIIRYLVEGIVCSFHIDEQNTLFLGRQSMGRISFLKIKPPYTVEDMEEVYGQPDPNVWMDIILFPDGDFVYSETRFRAGTEKREINFYNSRHILVLKDSLPVKAGLSSSLTRTAYRNGHFALGNGHIVKEYDLKTKHVKQREVEGEVINVYISRKNEIVIGFRDKGIKMLSVDTVNHPDYLILKGFSSSDILEDNNNIWYATLKNGLFFTGNSKYIRYDISNHQSKPVRFLRPLGKDQFVIGYERDGCFLYRLENENMNLQTDLGGPFQNTKVAWNVFQQSPELLFLSYTAHSHLYHCASQKVIRISNPAISNAAFSGVHFYKSDLIGYSYSRAVVFDPLDYSTKIVVSSDDRLTSFACDPVTGKAFFGAIHGLYTFYGQEEIVEKDRLHTFRVKDLRFLDSKLYIATKGIGLVVMSDTLLDTITSNKGLISNVCEKIFISGKDCWVSSNLGLSKVTYSGYGKYEVVNYPLKDFETPSLIQDFFVRDSTLYFASGPIVYAYPLAEQEERRVPFYIYSLEANNQLIQDRKDVELSSEQSNIRICFAALYYNFKGSVRYRYKLLPNDEEWIYTNENALLFPNLSAGSYSIVLQAQKNNGSWIECREKLQFTIQKPFWRKWWFILALSLAGGTAAAYLTYVLYKKKVGRELTENKLKIRLYNLEIKAMKAQMNPHFIFNSLNSIQYLILANENDNAYRYLTKFSKLVRMLLESNEKETLPVDTEVEILKRYLEIEALRLKDSFSYEINIHPSVEITKKIPHMMIQPFVENAIWHGLMFTKVDRRLSISFSQKNEWEIECIVEDNGIGINKNAEMKKESRAEKSLATEFIRERLQLFSNTMGRSYSFSITDKSESGLGETGTVVRICLPLFDN
jgi:hypothetical protein